MCGIAGIWSSARALAPVAPDARLCAMVAALRPRGPDGEGCFAHPRAHLGHTRLAIRDPARGAQPWQDGAITVVYNGELYNETELRAELAAADVGLRTRCDTELLAPLYRRHGPDFVARLEGMFALALFDAEGDRLLLARDRLGIKPLFWTRRGDELIFASDTRSLRAALPATPAPDPLALLGLLRYGSFRTARGCREGVALVPPAHRLVIEGGGAPVLMRYWWVPPVAAPDRGWCGKPHPTLPSPSGRSARTHGAGGEGPAAHETCVARTRALLEAAVERQLVSDVPVGAALSGGVDSGTVAALYGRRYPGTLRTYTARFEGPGDPGEHLLAAQSARQMDSAHVEVAIGSLDDLDRWRAVAARRQEPTANTAIFAGDALAARARRDVPVLLTGHGGDELFGGYVRFLSKLVRSGEGLGPAARVRRATQAAREIGLARLVGGLWRDGRDPLRAAFGLSPVFDREELRRLAGPALRPVLDHDFAPELAAFTGLDAESDAPRSRRMMVANLTTYLHALLLDEDHVDMAWGLEGRVPLCDTALVEFAAALPWQVKHPRMRLKALLKDAAADLVPGAVLRGAKRGFPTPWAAGVPAAFRARVARELAPALAGWFDVAALQRWLEGGRVSASALTLIITLACWFERG